MFKKVKNIFTVIFFTVIISTLFFVAAADGVFASFHSQPIQHVGPYSSGSGSSFTDFNSVVSVVVSLVNIAVPVLIGIAVFVFMAGILRYITAGDDMEKVKDGRDFIIYGILGIFIMISIWGIVYIFVNSFKLPTTLPTPQNTPIQIP